MKKSLRKHSRFIGQSLLWSLLLYITAILIMDWEEVRRSYKNEEQVVRIVPQEEPFAAKRIALPRNTGLLKAIWLHLVRNSHS